MTGGGFTKRNEIPIDQGATDYFNILINRNNEAIRAIVEPLYGHPSSSSSQPLSTTAADLNTNASQYNLQKVQDFYISCMNESALIEAGRQPLINQLDGILSSFPSLVATATTTAQEGTNISDHKKFATLALIQLLNNGLAGFVDITVITDPQEPSAHSLQLKESGLGLPSKEYYQDDKTMQLYENTIAQMFQIILGNEDVASRSQPPMDINVNQEWRDIAKTIVAFEIRLAEIGTELVDKLDPVKSNNPYTTIQLLDLIPDIDWTMLISKVLPRGVINMRPIIVQSPKYLSQLQIILKTTPLVVLRHYYTWVAIKNLGLYLGLPYRRPLQVLDAAIKGTSADFQPPRWKDCVAAINTNLGDLVGHFYVQEFFKGNSRESVISIIDSLIQSYATAFPTLSWLDELTLAGAIEKVHAIQKLIGYSTNSPNVASSSSLQMYYSDLNISKSDYYGNQHRYKVWKHTLDHKQLNQPVNQYKMEEYPQTVDAFYYGPMNHIVFPAGLLQPPFFHVDNPEYINYGAMGVAAGHEITHGFDNLGRNYDSFGRLKNWWTNITEAAFNEKAQCFVNQYSRFTIKGPDNIDYKVNGQLTLPENIADNGGLKQAFKAWQSRYQSSNSSSTNTNFKLPGLETFTPEQLFFISFGRIWCSKERPEYLLQLTRGNAHSPWRWRATGSVQNSYDFARAFMCPLGAPMNPVKKCEIW
ncbi:hypothetical protein FBU30_006026 [Linnemannia zychae]|nr:hypothetical protein FBU30_006026 [Linnemannia zychae]